VSNGAVRHAAWRSASCAFLSGIALLVTIVAIHLVEVTRNSAP